jgi:hypothetical protein
MISLIVLSGLAWSTLSLLRARWDWAGAIG